MLAYPNAKSSLKQFLLLDAKVLRFLHSEDALVGKPDRTYVPGGNLIMSAQASQYLVMSYAADLFIDSQGKGIGNVRVTLVLDLKAFSSTIYDLWYLELRIAIETSKKNSHRCVQAMNMGKRAAVHGSL